MSIIIKLKKETLEWLGRTPQDRQERFIVRRNLLSSLESIPLGVEVKEYKPLSPYDRDSLEHALRWSKIRNTINEMEGDL